MRSSNTKRKIETPSHFGVRIIAGIVGMAALTAGIFWVAGRLNWQPGWAYIGLLVCGQGLSSLYIWRKNPELLIRRGQVGKGTKTWDKIWLGLFGLMYLAILIVAALDAGRYGWSTMPVWLWIVGAAMYVFFVIVFTWAMAVNPYFEKTVRIQQDRGHRVVDSGPYRLVRHPGYVATIIGLIFSVPLLLGSWWAFMPAMTATLCLVVRTVFEDCTLQNELTGYQDYCRRVRYRLVPGIW